VKATEESSGGPGLAAAAKTPYVESLENEVLELKREKRLLQEKLDNPAGIFLLLVI